MLRTLPSLCSSFAALTTAALLASACSADDTESPTKNTPNAGNSGSGGSAGAPVTSGGQAGVSAGGNSAGVGGASTTAGSTSTGGVSTTGGSGGGGSSAGGSGTGGTPAQCLVCDDFEASSTGPDPAKWTIDTTRMVGAATIDSIGAHGSSKSLKVSGGYLKIDSKAGSLAGAASKFWVSLNMRFDQAQPSDHVTYLMLTDAAKSGELRLGAQNTGMIWNYSTNDTILPDYNEAANSLKPTANEWHCFELQFDSDTPAMHVFMDGTETQKMLLDATSTTGIDDRWMRDMPGWKPQITSFGFGAGDPTPGKVTTWYDDIAISNERPGCTF